MYVCVYIYVCISCVCVCVCVVCVCVCVCERERERENWLARLSVLQQLLMETCLKTVIFTILLADATGTDIARFIFND